MIGFAGLSHLGIVSSIAMASKVRDQIVAFSPDTALCGELSAGRFPIYEKGLAELFQENSCRVRFTSDARELKSCGVVHLSLDIATDNENRGNLDAFHNLFNTAVAAAGDETVIAVMSQLQPGTMRKLSAEIQSARERRGIQLFYQVETLIFGNAVDRAMKPERFIVGCADSSAELPGPYRAILDAFGCPVFRMRYESAELAKISINICLAASLTVANTMAELCEAVDADWAEIVPALKTDRRIGQYSYLVPGLGIGGGNIERDIAAVCDMARARGTDPAAAEAFLSNSQRRKSWPMEILKKHLLMQSKDPKIAVWGIAYKADTASVKNSPAIELIRAVEPLQVNAYDPQAALSADSPKNLRRADNPRNCIAGADALVIMTPWKEFSAIDPVEIVGAMSGRLVVDPFGVLDRSKCREAGLRLFVLGAAERIV